MISIVTLPFQHHPRKGSTGDAEPPAPLPLFPSLHKSALQRYITPHRDRILKSFAPGLSKHAQHRRTGVRRLSFWRFVPLAVIPSTPSCRPRHTNYVPTQESRNLISHPHSKSAFNSALETTTEKAPNSGCFPLSISWLLKISARKDAHALNRSPCCSSGRLNQHH
jgi:hypothetical protein